MAARSRIALACLIAWFPLCLLSIVEGRAVGGVRLPFVRDIEAHVRLLVTLPTLIGAEFIMRRRLGQLVMKFVTRGIIREPDVARFKSTMRSAARLAESFPVAIVVVVIAVALGVLFWQNQIARNVSAWYAIQFGDRTMLTRAGMWYVFVSLPFVTFLLLRWYFRMVIWAGFLWLVSRFKLHLIQTHPDRAGGLGFLGDITYIASPLLFAQAALLAALIAGRVLYGGQSLLSFKMEVIGFAGFLVIAALAPLTVFAGHLIRAKLDGLTTYGLLASDYVAGFEHKWSRDAAVAPSEPLLGTSDIQSLADLSNSYAIVTEMRVVPFTLSDAMRALWAVALPLLPLVFFVLPPEQLVEQIARILFKA